MLSQKHEDMVNAFNTTILPSLRQWYVNRYIEDTQRTILVGVPELCIARVLFNITKEDNRRADLWISTNLPNSPVSILVEIGHMRPGNKWNDCIDAEFSTSVSVLRITYDNGVYILNSKNTQIEKDLVWASALVFEQGYDYETLLRVINHQKCDRNIKLLNDFFDDIELHYSSVTSNDKLQLDKVVTWMNDWGGIHENVHDLADMLDRYVAIAYKIRMKVYNV